MGKFRLFWIFRFVFNIKISTKIALVARCEPKDWQTENTWKQRIERVELSPLPLSSSSLRNYIYKKYHFCHVAGSLIRILYTFEHSRVFRLLINNTAVLSKCSCWSVHLCRPTVSELVLLLFFRNIFKCSKE